MAASLNAQEQKSAAISVWEGQWTNRGTGGNFVFKRRSARLGLDGGLLLRPER